MKSIKLNKKVGTDGILHLDIPVEIIDTEVEIMVIYQQLTLRFLCATCVSHNYN